MIWVACAIVVVDVVLALVFLPVRLRINLQGRGMPDGGWALAGGAQVGPAAASGLAASGLEPRVQLHLFGREVYQRTLTDLLEKKDEPPEERPEGEPSWLDRYDRFERWFDPTAVAKFLLGEHRRVRITRADIDLDYSFADVALTGKVMAALSVLGGVLPPPISLKQKVSWKTQDDATVSIDAEIQAWPGLLVTDVVAFAVRNVRIRRPKPPELEQATEEP